MTLVAVVCDPCLRGFGACSPLTRMHEVSRFAADCDHPVHETTLILWRPLASIDQEDGAPAQAEPAEDEPLPEIVRAYRLLAPAPSVARSVCLLRDWLCFRARGFTAASCAVQLLARLPVPCVSQQSPQWCLYWLVSQEEVKEEKKAAPKKPAVATKTKAKSKAEGKHKNPPRRATVFRSIRR